MKLRLLAALAATLALLLLATPAAAQTDWGELNASVPEADYPALVHDGDRYLLFFEDMENNNVDIWSVHSTDLRNWSEPTRVTTDGEVDRRPRATTTRDGDVVLVFSSYRDGNYEVYTMRSPDGETWSDPTRVTENPRDDWYASVTELSDGRLLVPFSSNRDGPRSGVYLTTSSDGETWSEPRQVTAPSGDIFPYVVEKDGEYIMTLARHLEESDEAWRANEYEIFLTKSTDLEEWSDLAQLTDTEPGHESLYPHLTKDRDGTLWLPFTSSEPGNEEIFVTASRDGETWSDPVRVTRNVEYLRSVNSSASFKCDMKSAIQTQGGDLVVAYETSRGDTEQTRFVRMTPEVNTSATTTLSFEHPRFDGSRTFTPDGETPTGEDRGEGGGEDGGDSREGNPVPSVTPLAAILGLILSAAWLLSRH